jgi:hypothetical protein
MIIGVFEDLKYFLGFYLFVLCLFTTLFYVLGITIGESYGTVGNLGYFFMSFRTSTGDFEVDEYPSIDYAVVRYLAWLIWLFAVLILNVVFMNFIIAVISESYEKIMQKLVSQTFKVKVDLI